MSRPELLRLLSACKQDPDDTTARLVLADWLEEHGDAERAAFVRLDAGSGVENGRPRLPALEAKAWRAGHDRWAPYQALMHPDNIAINRRGLVEVPAMPAALTGPAAARWAGTEEWAWVETVAVRPEMRGIKKL